MSNLSLNSRYIDKLIEDEKSSSVKKFRFPPESAPEHVKEAFESLSDLEKWRINLLTYIMYDTKNMRMDHTGRVIKLQPGDPGYIDVFAVFEDKGFDYVQHIEQLLDFCNNLKVLEPQGNYDDFTEPVQKFKDALIN